MVLYVWSLSFNIDDFNGKYIYGHDYASRAFGKNCVQPSYPPLYTTIRQSRHYMCLKQLWFKGPIESKSPAPLDTVSSDIKYHFTMIYLNCNRQQCGRHLMFNLVHQTSSPKSKQSCTDTFRFIAENISFIIHFALTYRSKQLRHS